MSRHSDHLATIPLFSACSAHDLSLLARVSDEVTVPAGHELTTQGELGHEVFVVVSGTARVTKDGVDVVVVGPGDVLGELSLLDGGPRTATCTATTEMTLLVLSRPAFNGVLDEIPTLAHKLLVAVARRLRESEQSLTL